MSIAARAEQRDSEATDLPSNALAPVTHVHNAFVASVALRVLHCERSSSAMASFAQSYAQDTFQHSLGEQAVQSASGTLDESVATTLKRDALRCDCWRLPPAQPV